MENKAKEKKPKKGTIKKKRMPIIKNKKDEFMAIVKRIQSASPKELDQLKEDIGVLTDQIEEKESGLAEIKEMTLEAEKAFVKAKKIFERITQNGDKFFKDKKGPINSDIINFLFTEQEHDTIKEYLYTIEELFDFYATLTD